MRLLNSITLQMEEFISDSIPEYAILSHTWGEEEVSFRDIQGVDAAKMKGFTKLQNCCALVARDSFNYVWIDTCCIDKSSSAELSEAINSMYKWYKNAKTCYAHLEDVVVPADVSDLEVLELLRPSRWFTRGWTLQELIAPSTVKFYDKTWNNIGSKKSLQKVLCDITGIDIRVLGGDEPWACNVAQRMSWASDRTTTRVEDIAYCLMGLFHVNMPLLYGEGGSKAFSRLQEEIIKGTEDHSLFTWFAKDAQPRLTCRGLLASSPQEFGNSKSHTLAAWQYSELLVHSSINFGTGRNPWGDPHSLTSRGLRMSLPLKRKDGEHPQGIEYLACLNCQTENHKFLCVYLQRLPTRDQIYGRVRAHEVVLVPSEEVNTFEDSTIYIVQSISNGKEVYKLEDTIRMAPTNWSTRDFRPWYEPQLRTSGSVTVNDDSRLIPGLNEFDITTARNIRVKAFVDPKIDDTFRVHIDALYDTILYGAGVSLLHVYTWDRDIQAGIWSIPHVSDPQPSNVFQGHITFKRRYSTAPIVIVWLTGFDFETHRQVEIQASVTNVTTTSFEIKIKTGPETLLYWASTSWIAYYSDTPRIKSGSYSTRDVRPTTEPKLCDSGKVDFAGEQFPWAPTVLVGINEFHFDGSQGTSIRCVAKTSHVTEAGFNWELNSWEDGAKYLVGASYLALDNGPPTPVGDVNL